MTGRMAAPGPTARRITAAWWEATRRAPVDRAALRRVRPRASTPRGAVHRLRRAPSTSAGGTSPAPAWWTRSPWFTARPSPELEVPYVDRSGPAGRGRRAAHPARTPDPQDVAHRRPGPGGLASTSPTAGRCPSSFPPAEVTHRAREVRSGLPAQRGAARVPRAAARVRRPGDHPGRPGVGADRPVPDRDRQGRWPTWACSGITVPEEYGGLDLDPVSFALVFEEISRGWMGIAGILGSHSLACRMIAMHGTDEQKQRVPAGPRHRRAPHRHRADRTGRRHRPAGHPHDRPARRRPLRGQRHQDVDHQRPARQPAAGAGEDRPVRVAGAQGDERAAHRQRPRGFQGDRGTSPSWATRAPSPARSCWTTCGCPPTGSSAASRAAA